MTTLSQQASSAARPWHIAKTAALVLFFWALAALAVVALHGRFSAAFPVECVIAQTLTIITAAFLYMRFGAEHGTIDHALFVGASWLVLAIVSELVITAYGRHAWFGILGSPASALRNVLLFAWILSPALFASHPG